jgi:hypothetical protein
MYIAAHTVTLRSACLGLKIWFFFLQQCGAAVVSSLKIKILFIFLPQRGAAIWSVEPEDLIHNLAVMWHHVVEPVKTEDLIHILAAVWHCSRACQTRRFYSHSCSWLIVALQSSLSRRKIWFIFLSQFVAAIGPVDDEDLIHVPVAVWRWSRPVGLGTFNLCSCRSLALQSAWDLIPVLAAERRWSRPVSLEDSIHVPVLVWQCSWAWRSWRFNSCSCRSAALKSAF